MSKNFWKLRWHVHLKPIFLFKIFETCTYEKFDQNFTTSKLKEKTSLFSFMISTSFISFMQNFWYCLIKHKQSSLSQLSC